jgi:hypothetical protein
MPIETRTAMHDAIQKNSIIVGAYVDRDGGVCPMLAAHRNGGRTSFASFAKAWDRYTRATTPRRATEREVRTLVAMLEASIAVEEAIRGADLTDAIAEHREMQRTRARREEHAPVRPDNWLRTFRRLDDYEQALAEIEAASHVVAGTDELEFRDEAVPAGSQQ